MPFIGRLSLVARFRRCAGKKTTAVMDREKMREAGRKKVRAPRRDGSPPPMSVVCPLTFGDQVAVNVITSRVRKGCPRNNYCFALLNFISFNLLTLAGLTQPP